MHHFEETLYHTCHVDIDHMFNVIMGADKHVGVVVYVHFPTLNSDTSVNTLRSSSVRHC